MDFFSISTREAKGGVIEVYPDFTVGRSKDLMVRGRSFYAIWAEEQGLWSTDEYDVQRLVDEALHEYAEKLKADGVPCNVKYLRSFTTNGWNQFRKFISNVSDNSHPLDESLTFANTKTKKTDYVSKCLPYSLQAGDHSAWDKLVGTLYNPDERAKIEWAIGSVISGDSKKLQKFLVLYGPGGTGKSTVLNIVQKLFDGYTTSFEAKALVGNNNAFSTEMFKSNPLVAIQHDGDLSKIEDATKLHSIVSHEEMTMNEKYKPSYTSRINAFLWMGTNKPVRITDAKSGIIRRLIDVHPTGLKFTPKEYHALMARIDFELGAIAHHCLEVYREMGKNFYNSYRPLEMMLQTDVFFNFIEANFDIFKEQDGATLRQAYALYKEYVQESGLDFSMPQYRFREELKNYFTNFDDRTVVDSVPVRSYYSGFTAQPFKVPLELDTQTFSLVMDETTSLFDLEYVDQPAQYAKANGTPRKYWDDEPRMINGEWKTPQPSQIVSTTLAEIDTSQEHFVKPPENMIVVDFDLKGDDGERSLERNLAAASSWPATYAELSKSGAAVHLHYNYTGTGSLAELDPNYSDGIEIKTFAGNGSLRRRLTKCNNVPVADLASGLPVKEKKVLNTDTIKSEKGLRDLIARNLRKEIHPGTKPSIDFIAKILEETYLSGVSYDVTDLRSKIAAFANNSTNQAMTCLKTVQKMRFKSDEPAKPIEVAATKDERLVFFDVEVYPNLFVICWKYQGAPTVVRMINPSAKEVEALLQLRLVGFNNRRYDNHIIYAAIMGYDNDQLYRLSHKITDDKTKQRSVGVLFGEAYGLSYTDIFDFSSKRQGLKKFQIEYGIHHQEMDIPWDKPVPKERIMDVVDYCANDVVSTEVVFERRKQDFVARQILADLSGLTVNDTTPKLTAKIIFGDDRNPQRAFVYTKLDKEFPGYVFEKGLSTYRGEVVGEGGYVFSEPGMYENVALEDVASMHPASLIQLNAFGEYTPRFAALVDARLAIKHKNYTHARELMGGKLAPFLEKEEDAKALSDALKIVINTVYGLTSAKFDNPFRDVRNVDNIVAKRGALFMIDLKHYVQEQGFTVAHIKTDSIKIPNATPEIIEQVKVFGQKYGYTFEYDPKTDFYDAFCLVNDAVYIARKGTDFIAVGAQFQHPYVFKTLFTQEPITFDDMCETKQVTQGAMYLDFTTLEKTVRAEEDLHFIGRTGRFVPVQEGFGGGTLLRIKDGKQYAVTGTKGYLWIEAEMAKSHGDALDIDTSYFDRLVDEAQKSIDYYGEFTRLVGR